MHCPGAVDARAPHIDGEKTELPQKMTRHAPLRTASRDLDALDARFLQFLQFLDRCAAGVRAARAPLVVIVLVAVAMRAPCIKLRDPGADLREQYGAPGAGGHLANVYFVNRTHLIKQVRWPCTTPHHSQPPPRAACEDAVRS